MGTTLPGAEVATGDPATRPFADNGWQFASLETPLFETQDVSTGKLADEEDVLAAADRTMHPAA